MSPYVIRLIAAALAAALPPSAQAQTRLEASHDDQREVRRQNARELLEAAADSGLDPRREPAGLISAAQAASLLWKVSPEAAGDLYDRTLRRAHALLAAESSREATIRVLPIVLANFAARDAEAALDSVESLAETASFGDDGGRARLYGAIAEAVAPSHPDAARLFAIKSFASPGAGASSWNVIRHLDDDAAAQVLRAGIAALERDRPPIPVLFDAAGAGQIIAFSRTAEPGPNATPEILRRWSHLVALRLGWVRDALVEARAAGAPPAIADDELSVSLAIAPALLDAVRKWAPDGADTARAAVIELQQTPAARALVRDEPDAQGNGSAADDARILRAYELARRDQAPEARAEIAFIQNPEARKGASDDVELVLASREFERGELTAVQKRIASLGTRSLQVRVFGLIARTLAERGAYDAALEVGAAAVKSAARADADNATVAGLLDAALAFGLAGDSVRAHESLRDAVDALDRFEAASAPPSPCQCWPMALAPFGTTSVSGGLIVSKSDLALAPALGAEATRDLVGALSLARLPRTPSARETTLLALARALEE